MEPSSLRSSLPLARLFPNIVTLVGLSLGMTALRHAWQQDWERAVWLLVIAALLDGVDGRLARLLKATSPFGAQLDSLSDFFCFGVAPASLIYFWSLQYLSFPRLGWMIVLFYVICSAIRLARFNVSTAQPPSGSAWRENFFEGVPMPAGAMMMLLPMMLDFGWNMVMWTPTMVAIHSMVVAFLMVSRLPTLSIKKWRVRKEKAPLVMACLVGLIMGLLLDPWVVLPLMTMAYWVSLPWVCWRWWCVRRGLRRAEDSVALPEGPL
jgi:CDP-diacylglycerol--serine O-phosphatidyltransferase